MGTGQGKKVTLASVATMAKVSKITVSRAFSQPDKVHPDTLSRILETSKQMGYVVNAAARSLRAKASKTIGIVNPDMANPFFAGLTRQMTLEAQKMSYDTLVFDSYESEDNERRIIDKLIGYNVDAIILSVISSDRNYYPEYLKRLEMLDIPVVLVDREIDVKYCSGVYIDNFDCGLQAGRYLLEKQAKRVVVISGPEDSNVARERITGLTAVLQNKMEVLDIIHADFYMAAAARETTHYLQHNPLPDFFVGCNNQISLGIVKACQENGVCLMKDVSLFGIDQVTYADIYGYHFPCIDHDLYEIAWQALNLAIRRSTEKDCRPAKVIVRGRIMI